MQHISIRLRNKLPCIGHYRGYIDYNRDVKIVYISIHVNMETILRWLHNDPRIITSVIKFSVRYEIGLAFVPYHV